MSAMDLFKSNAAGPTKRKAIEVLEKHGGYEDPREADRAEREARLNEERRARDEERFVREAEERAKLKVPPCLPLLSVVSPLLARFPSTQCLISQP